MTIALISIISILLTYCSRFRRTRYCFEVAIILLTLFWSIRYEFGNDYAIYLSNFDSIKAYGDSIIELEYGWVLLNKVFSHLGFSWLVLFITLIQFYSIYFYLKRYVDVKYRWFVLMFYIINPSLMIHSLSGLRQTIAMSIVIFALHMIYKRKYIPSLIIILLAAQFHTSAYFMLLLPLTLFFQNVKKETYVCLLVSIFILCFFFRDAVLGFTNSIIQFDSVAKYQDYLQQSELIYEGSGIGVLLKLFVLVILLKYDKHENNFHNWILKLYQLSFIFIPLYMILPIFNRMQIYFLLLGIGATPLLIKASKNNPLNGIITILLIILTVWGFIYTISHGSYSNYTTILTNNNFK